MVCFQGYTYKYSNPFLALVLLISRKTNPHQTSFIAKGGFNKINICHINITCPIVFCGEVSVKIPQNFIVSNLIPVSSKVSRMADFKGLSKGSSFPPTAFLNYVFVLIEQ